MNKQIIEFLKKKSDSFKKWWNELPDDKKKYYKYGAIAGAYALKSGYGAYKKKKRNKKLEQYKKRMMDSFKEFESHEPQVRVEIPDNYEYEETSTIREKVDNTKSKGE